MTTAEPRVLAFRDGAFPSLRSAMGVGPRFRGIELDSDVLRVRTG